jgi:hypothetical protein
LCRGSGEGAVRFVFRSLAMAAGKHSEGVMWGDVMMLHTSLDEHAQMRQTDVEEGAREHTVRIGAFDHSGSPSLER